MPEPLSPSLQNIDAILVHCMGSDPHQERPSLRGRSIVWAGVYLAWKLNIPHLVFSGHHYYGSPERLSLGKVTAQEAIQELEAAHLKRQVEILPSFPVQSVRSKNKTEYQPVTDTSGEVLAFLAFAQLHNLHHLASISSQTHLASIEQLYQLKQIEAQIFSAEQVLPTIPGEIGHRVYLDVINQILESEDETDFRKRERLKRLLYSLPGGIGVKWLRAKATRDRSISSLPATWESITTNGH